MINISLNRLQLQPEVLDVLNDLRSRYKLAAIFDAQSTWCLPEMSKATLARATDTHKDKPHKLAGHGPSSVAKK